MYSFSQSDICTSDFYVISTHLFTGAPVIPICFRTKDVTVFICSVGCPTVATESLIIVRHNNRGYFTFLSAVIFSFVKGTFKHVADARAGRSQRISQFGIFLTAVSGFFLLLSLPTFPFLSSFPDIFLFLPLPDFLLPLSLSPTFSSLCHYPT